MIVREYFVICTTGHISNKISIWKVIHSDRQRKLCSFEIVEYNEPWKHKIWKPV